MVSISLAESYAVTAPTSPITKLSTIEIWGLGLVFLVLCRSTNITIQNTNDVNSKSEIKPDAAGFANNAEANFGRSTLSIIINCAKNTFEIIVPIIAEMK